MSKKVITGIKLIRLNSSNVNEPDDQSYPFKIEASLKPPEFMQFAFIGLYGGTEEVVVRAMTKEAVEEFLTLNNLRHHPRLRHFTVSGPDGVMEEFKK